MKAAFAVVTAAVACSTFDSLDPVDQVPVTWGNLVVAVGTTGLDTYDRNLYMVALDSAIQGYAVRHTEGDTVWIEPVLAGEHHLRLSGVRSYCEVEDGSERVFVMNPGQTISIVFSVHCADPVGMTTP